MRTTIPGIVVSQNASYSCAILVARERGAKRNATNNRKRTSHPRESSVAHIGGGFEMLQSSSHDDVTPSVVTVLLMEMQL